VAGLHAIPKRLRNIAASVLGGVLAAVILCTGLAAYSSCHQDHHLANGAPAQHFCAVCLIASSHLVVPDITCPAVFRPSTFELKIAVRDLALAGLAGEGLPSCRAPPVVFS
jgi:hypothetical protein